MLLGEIYLNRLVIVESVLSNGLELASHSQVGETTYFETRLRTYFRTVGNTSSSAVSISAKLRSIFSGLMGKYVHLKRRETFEQVQK